MERYGPTGDALPRGSSWRSVAEGSLDPIVEVPAKLYPASICRRTKRIEVGALHEHQRRNHLP